VLVFHLQQLSKVTFVTNLLSIHWLAYSASPVYMVIVIVALAVELVASVDVNDPASITTSTASTIKRISLFTFLSVNSLSGAVNDAYMAGLFVIELIAEGKVVKEG